MPPLRTYLLICYAFALLLLPLLAACNSTPPDSPEKDREALIALYNSAYGEEWHWYYELQIDDLDDLNVDKWPGVTVDSNGRVVQLFLSGYNLDGGYLPSDLGSLSRLRFLNLNNNQLSGEIPAKLGNLASLEHLDLGYNRLSGKIPAELGNLANLERLYLGGNQLSGKIPAELGNLANLERLYLGGNQLSGEIPAELGNLANLKYLGLGGNQLSGCIPKSLQSQLNRKGTDLGGLPYCTE